MDDRSAREKLEPTVIPADTGLRWIHRLSALSAAATTAVALLGPAAQGRAPGQDAAKFARFDDWYRRYSEGRIVLAARPGRLPTGTRTDSLRPEGELHAALRECVRAESREAADRLLTLASFHFNENPAIEAERFDALLPGQVREAAVSALASFRSRAVLDYLARDVLLDRARSSPERRAAAAAALGAAKDEQALLALFQAASDPSPIVRVAAIDAAVSVGGSRAAPVLRSIDDASPDVRLRVLDAMFRYLSSTPADGDVERDRTLASALKNLGAEDWRERDRVLDIIAAFPTRDAVPALITALAAERDRLAAGTGRKRVQVRIGELLATITGADIPLLDAGKWTVWWQVAGDKFRLGGEVSGRPRTRAVMGAYFEIPIKSDHMVFAVDVSGSMNEPCGAPPIATGAEPQPASSPPPSSWTKLERVKHELLHVIRGLKDTDLFQIVAFSDSAVPAFSELSPANKANKKIAERFVTGLRANGGTALFDALIVAMDLRATKGKPTHEQPDTVFLLTDGQPTMGSVVDPDDILRRIGDVNRTARIEIHTLFAGAAYDMAARFLMELARENRGEYRRIPER